MKRLQSGRRHAQFHPAHSADDQQLEPRNLLVKETKGCYKGSMIVQQPLSTMRQKWGFLLPFYREDVSGSSIVAVECNKICQGHNMVVIHTNSHGFSLTCRLVASVKYHNSMGQYYANECKIVITLMFIYIVSNNSYMWQSQVEIVHYSAAYLDCVTEFEAL